MPARVLAVLEGSGDHRDSANADDGDTGRRGGDEASSGRSVEIFLDRTPFYAEQGGQVGDTGTIVTESGIADVYDTQYPLPGLVAHKARLSGDMTAGQDALATIDVGRREAIRRNHTATHLLHAALRAVLGEHVRQQGSLVGPDYLRFDFSHHAQPTRQELDAVFEAANDAVLTDVRRGDDRDDARGGREHGRHRLLRRQVRRVGACRAGWADVARVLRRHPRRLARPDRADHAALGGLHRLEHAARLRPDRQGVAAAGQGP